MIKVQLIWFFALASGLASSGAICNLWPLITGEPLELKHFEEPDILTPVRALAFVFAAPFAMINSALRDLRNPPFFATGKLLLALAWSFFQGVFIMHEIFGVA